MINQTTTVVTITGRQLPILQDLNFSEQYCW